VRWSKAVSPGTFETERRHVSNYSVPAALRKDVATARWWAWSGDPVEHVACACEAVGQHPMTARSDQPAGIARVPRPLPAALTMGGTRRASSPCRRGWATAKSAERAQTGLVKWFKSPAAAGRRGQIARRLRFHAERAPGQRPDRRGGGLADDECYSTWPPLLGSGRPLEPPTTDT
jgi:hypothetical protein